MPYDFDLVCIGSGPAGQRAAVQAAKLGKRVADVVLFAIGRIGATKELDLDKVGLTADDRGRLRVNEHFQTSVPHILAAGDVIGFPSLAATSSEQGRLAACFAFGAEALPMAAHFPIGIYSIPEISMVGSPEHELTRQRVPYEVGITRYREIARGQILGDDSGLFKMLFHRETYPTLAECYKVAGLDAANKMHA